MDYCNDSCMGVYDECTGSLRGELVRAVWGIRCKWVYEHKAINDWKPDKDCNSMARFIMKKGSLEMKQTVKAMWNLTDYELYYKGIDDLINELAEIVDGVDDSEDWDIDCLSFWDYEDIHGKPEDGESTWIEERNKEIGMYPALSWK